MERERERDGLSEEEEEKDSLVVLPVDRKKKTKVGERKLLSLKLPGTVSHSSESSYYQSQSAFIGHNGPDMFSVA